MKDQRMSEKKLALWLSGLVVAAFLLFLATGGDLGGTKRVESDADLPQVTSPTHPSGENTGSR